LRKFDLTSIMPENAFSQMRAKDIAAPETLDLDLLIAFATSGPVSDIWHIAKMGVISVSHSDDRIHRGGPVGFWEVYSRNDVTGFTIQHLTRPADTGEVLLRGMVATQYYYLLNQASLFQKSSHYLIRVVEKIARTGVIPQSELRVPFCYSPRGIPKLYQGIFYLFRLSLMIVANNIRKIRGEERWNVAFVHVDLHDDWRHVALWRANVIKNPPKHYLADPFLIKRDGKDFCFVEDFDEEIQRGKIAAYELGKDGATRLGDVIVEDFHMSFPYLFEYKGELYMCPETAAAREIRIYKCLEFPLRWNLEKVIMKDISAADTLLFEWGGKWWMLTNIDPAQWDDFSLELCLFSADSPLNDQWTPHPNNPVLIDASLARNGGMVREGERLFRVAQGQGFAKYGKRTTVNEIIKLTDESYVEHCVCVISPEFRKGMSRTHHMHSNGTTTIVDFI